MAISLLGRRAVVAPEVCLIAMLTQLTAYFDDSGKPADSEVVVLCGFVAGLDQWLAFERHWNAVLRMPQFDLEHFHMKELRQARGRFAKFHNNDQLRRDLFERLQRLIQVYAMSTWAGIVIMKDYNAANAEYQIEEHLGPPGIVAAELAIGKLVIRWWPNVYPDTPMQIVCDQGMDHFGTLSDHMYQLFGFRPIPGAVSQVPGLQAADFAAWELRRVMADTITERITDWAQMRPTLLNFLEGAKVGDGTRTTWFVVDESQLRRLIENGPIAKRDASERREPVVGPS